MLRNLIGSLKSFTKPISLNYSTNTNQDVELLTWEAGEGRMACTDWQTLPMF